MTKPKHTPGPWTLEGSTIKGSDGGTICTFRYPIYPLSTGPDEYSSNARLIAAAPEMLEALKLTLKDLEAGSAAEVAMLKSIRVARSAIAKATGGEG